MRIEYVHASKFGNGARVAGEFKDQMAAKGVVVEVHHVKDLRARQIPSADLYVFSSPGRMGRPIGRMRRFLKRLRLPTGSRYALLTTEGAPVPDKDGKMPSAEKMARYQRMRPIMNGILQSRGLVNVAEDRVLVTGMRGPLEESWQKKVESFAARLPTG